MIKTNAISTHLISPVVSRSFHPLQPFPLRLLNIKSMLILFILFFLISPLHADSGTAKQALKKLYSSRFLLTKQGVPIVTVRLMKGRSSIEFSLTQPGQIRLYKTGKTPKTVQLLANYSYSLKMIYSTPAKYTYSVIAAQLAHFHPVQWQRKVTLWKKRGHALRAKNLGSVFSLKGQLFDNRKRIGLLGNFKTKMQAEKLAAQLNRKHGHTYFLYKNIKSYPSALFRIQGNQGQWVARNIVAISSIKERGHVLLKKVEHGRGYRWHGYQDRLYKGRILFAPNLKGELSVINQVKLSSYLAGVLPAEMPASAPLEALKAQAICARNEILSKIGTRHFSAPSLFCASTHCQVYSGASKAKSRTNRAIRATRGVVMVTSSGHLSSSPFSANCGGHSEHNENVWFTPRSSSLRGKQDNSSRNSKYKVTHSTLSSWLQSPPFSFCKKSKYGKRNKNYRWKRAYQTQTLTRLINRVLPIGTIKEIIILKRGVSGRIYKLRLIGSQKSLTYSGEWKIRKLLGRLPSSMFVLQRKKRIGQSDLWFFTGGGWGHGVGLCQQGAIGRARAGIKFKQILRHYFSHIQLKKIY